MAFSVPVLTAAVVALHFIAFVFAIAERRCSTDSSKQIATSRSLLQSPLLHLLLLASVLSASFSVSLADAKKAIGKQSPSLGSKGTAAYYEPSSSWTECNHEDPSQFPKSQLFAAAGQNLWDGKAACGREYEVWCISEAKSGPGNCSAGSVPIRVKVLDSADSSACAPKQSVRGADLVLSKTAFRKIAKPFVVSIKVGFKEV